MMSITLRRTFRRLRPPLVAASLLALTGTVVTVDDSCIPDAQAAPKRAKPIPKIHMAAVELVEHAPKSAPKVSRYQLAVSDEGPTSRLIHDDDGTRTILSVTWIPKPGPAPLIRLEVERTETSGPRGQRRHSEIQSSGRIAPGKGMLFGRINRPGGGRIDVRLTLS